MSFKLGVLVCDKVDQAFDGEYDNYTDMFAKLLKTQDANIEISSFELVAGERPIDINACDAYVITGSRQGVYEEIPWIIQAKQLVRDIYAAKVPTIGICFGHQLIASALGGEVIKEEQKGHALGVKTWEIVDSPEWMEEHPQDSLSLYVSHQDQVITMPRGAKLFASSDFCPIAGFEIGSMLTFQGHPEFDRSYSEYLFDKHKIKLDEATKEKTIQSLETKADSHSVGRWIIQFIKNAENKEQH